MYGPTVLTLWVLLAYCCALQPEITTNDGKIAGMVIETISGKEVNAYLSIPYAKPPIGPLRFKEPVPVEPWTTTLNATVEPTQCLQAAVRNIGDENCLFLNIYTPKNVGDKLLHVIFVIHGGGFQNGQGYSHGPEYLLDEVDVIMVTFNYRLGILGFLSLQDHILPGNNGLKDQLLALKWVKKNIAAFGGDPDKITLSGCSAGGASVHAHVLSPLSKGLFHKAMAISGMAVNPWSLTKNAKAKALRISEALGCPTDDSEKIVDCLRTKSADLIMKQTELFIDYLVYDSMAIVPVIEKPSPTAFLSKHPEDIIRSGEASDVPFLITHTDDDALFLAAEIFVNPKAAEELETKWDDLLPTMFFYNVKSDRKHEVAQAIKQYYFGDKSIMDSPKELSLLFTDRFLSIGIQRAAKLHAEYSKSPVYFHIFTYAGGYRLADFHNISEIYRGGACHADDFMYVFKTEFIHKRLGDPKEDLMSKTLISIWMKFIEETPTTGWKTVQSGLPNINYLEVSSYDNSKNSFKTLKDFPAEAFWNSLNLNNEDITKDNIHQEL